MAIWLQNVGPSGSAVFHVPQTNLTMKATKQLQTAVGGSTQQRQRKAILASNGTIQGKTCHFSTSIINLRLCPFQTEQKERLEAAHHHTVGQLAKVVEDKFSVNFSPPALAAVAKLSLHYIEEAATDIEAFAK